MEYMGRLDGKTLVQCLVQNRIFTLETQLFIVSGMNNEISVVERTI
jgi:hypothetical protein